jgi:uncharacterized membrane protein
MITPPRVHREQTGLVGKMIVVWLLMVVILGVAAIDTASIAFTKFKASDVASTAASLAANTWRDTNSDQRACNAARASVAQADPDAVVPKNGCVVNQATGEVTITVRKAATTLLASRLPWTKKFANPLVTETAGPSVL